MECNCKVFAQGKVKNCYKGKTVETKKWIAGNFINDIETGKCYICTMTNGSLAMQEVYPESVGAYTHYDDSDGYEIFAGDILRFSFRGFTFDGVVRYGEYEEKNNKEKQFGFFIDWYKNSGLLKSLCKHMNEAEWFDDQMPVYIVGNQMDTSLEDLATQLLAEKKGELNYELRL